MFGELQLTTYQVEALLPDYLFRGDLQPRGSFLTYLNDRTRPYLVFGAGEMFPLAADRQVGGMKQNTLVVSKQLLALLSVLDEAQARDAQLLASKRPVIFHVGAFAVQGQLHVNADARDDDLLDETRDFFAVSEASVFPLKALGASLTRRVPLVFLNRLQVQAYHVSTPK
ncbi:MAG: hypothetical protein L0332_31355 [Chloroflexi bacterium]|nr:hypothetical protein [Chloroflexota bacterium]MCI0576316.1 hypothetical protein [Chloroflexota bacterium]MCI0650115.1 hypothetical protein [Chloroflexota bacterium]MCI0731199.1 hypothetical protein [Chloroflexota bacterium]